MSSPLKIETNQRNAQHSTGPKTGEGKQRSALNATRHGFTGLSLVITPAENEAYTVHVQAYLDQHQPATHQHKQLVQQLADLHWSIHQIFVQQTNTISLMNGITVQMSQAGDPVATAAAIAPVARTLNTLNLYETRRRRAAKAIQAELAELEQIILERRANQQPQPALKPEPVAPGIGSVYSAPAAAPTMSEIIARECAEMEAEIARLEALQASTPAV